MMRSKMHSERYVCSHRITTHYLQVIRKNESVVVDLGAGGLFPLVDLNFRRNWIPELLSE